MSQKSSEAKPMPIMLILQMRKLHLRDPVCQSCSASMWLSRVLEVGRSDQSAQSYAGRNNWSRRDAAGVRDAADRQRKCCLLEQSGGIREVYPGAWASAQTPPHIPATQSGVNETCKCSFRAMITPSERTLHRDTMSAKLATL